MRFPWASSAWTWIVLTFPKVTFIVDGVAWIVVMGPRRSPVGSLLHPLTTRRAISETVPDVKRFIPRTSFNGPVETAASPGPVMDSGPGADHPCGADRPPRTD